MATTDLLLRLLVLQVIISEVDSRYGYCAPCSCQWFNNATMRMDCKNTSFNYIPRPEVPKPNTIKLSVYFVGHNIPLLTKEMLSNLTSFQLYYLSLRNNGIRNISQNAFRGLKYLYGFDISENNVLSSDLQRAFSGLSNLRSLRLNISSMGIGQPDESLFRHLASIQEVNITIRNNSISSFPYAAIHFLNMRFMDMTRNPISNLSLPDNCSYPPLKTLILNHNAFTTFPNFCINGMKSPFPNLTEVTLKNNDIRTAPKEHYKCLVSLTAIHLDGTLLSSLMENQFSDLPNLSIIGLNNAGCAMETIQGYVFNNTALKQLYLKKNHLWLRRQEVNLTMFHGCTSLEILDLNDNVFQVTKDRDFDILFKGLRSLTNLAIGRGGLYSIPQIVTRELVTLRTLVLSGNNIPNIADGALDNLTQLVKIAMKNNKISLITDRTFPKGFEQNLKSVDFSSNPFSCTCDLLWFINWMKSHLDRFNKSLLYDYVCESPSYMNGIPLLNVTLSEHECMLGQNEKIMTLSTSILLIVFLVVTSFLYRYRWHIRYFIYMVRYRQRQETDVDIGQYDYDAFVAYSADDRQWVIKSMLPVLETNEKLKICVHDRDFMVGRLIVDNIVDGIEKSRKVIIVLSNSFAQSSWCQFELNLIQRHVLENGQCLLVVVMLEEIESRHVTKAMRAMLQTTTYLLWGEEDYAKIAFFNRLRMLLRTGRVNGGRRLSV